MGRASWNPLRTDEALYRETRKRAGADLRLAKSPDYIASPKHLRAFSCASACAFRFLVRPRVKALFFYFPPPRIGYLNHWRPIGIFYRYFNESDSFQLANSC